MLDSGCTRTCIRQGEPFLQNVELVPTNDKIVCANKQTMTCAGTTTLKFEFTESYQVNVNSLVVPNLSAPVILGMDVIQDLHIIRNANYCELNFQKLKLCDPFDTSRVASLKNMAILEPFSESLVPIVNVIKNSNVDLISITGLKSQKSSDEYTITPGIYKNENIIHVMITNRTNKRIHVRRNRKICTMEPIEIEKCNGLTTLPNKLEESQMVAEFQERREKRAQKCNFKPEMGSFGEMDEEKKYKINKIIQNNRLAFTMGPDDLGQVANFAFTLPLHDETDTAHQPPRPIPIHIKPKVDAAIQTWKELGIIEHTQSGFNIPLIILKKGDGSVRVSLDARELNTKLKQDRYPLPHMTTIFTKIGEKLTTGKECWISVFDFHRGYWNVRVDPKDKHKLAFSYDGQHFCSNRMLYGTSTSPACFSRIMMELFGKNDSFLLYLDDLIIIDSSFDEHQKSLQFLFETSQKYGLLLSPKKAHICKQSIDFLGHTINKDGIEPLQKHKKCVDEFPRPKDKKSLKRFLGLVNFNLKFIPRASIILSPLYQICSIKRDFDWGDDQERAFLKIKDELLNAKSLRHRNPNLPLRLVTDAALAGVGATLYQINNDKWEAIGYFSRALSPPDQRRPMRVKELLALVYAIRSFEYYLINVPFKVISDHKSLMYLYNEHLKTALDHKLTNIFYYLQNFEFAIFHAAGTSDVMASADCLSRIPSSSFAEMEEILNQNEVPDKIFTMVHLPEKANEEICPKMKVYLRALARGTEEPTIDEEDDEDGKIILRFEDYVFSEKEMLKRQDESKTIANIKNKIQLKAKSATKKFIIDDDLVYNITKSTKRIALPECVSNEFLKYLHVIYGHCGSYQLIKLASKHVYILNIQEKANMVCKLCVDCLRNKSRKMLRPSLIEKRSFESLPWSKTSIDLFDLGKADYRRKRYLVTAVDHLTGFVEAVPISNKTDVIVAKAVHDIILRHGLTNVIITDNGAEFGKLFKEILDKFKILHVNTAAYQSRSNGKVERIHREIVAKLKLLGTKRGRWSDDWAYVQFLLNNLPKTSLDSLSASEALYGRALFVPFETIEPVKNDAEPYVKALNDYINQIHPSLMKFQYEKYSKLLEKDTNKAPTLKIGSKALIWRPQTDQGKLSKSWAGPYVINKRISKDTYILRDPETKRSYRRNVRHLRPLHSSATDRDQNQDENQEAETEQNKTDKNKEIENQEYQDEFERNENFANLPFRIPF